MKQSVHMLVMGLLILGVVGCEPVQPTITPTEQPICGIWKIDGTPLGECVTISPETTLMQAGENTQATLKIDSVHITLTGTTVTHYADALTIATLEGTTVVSAKNASRILQPGAQITLSLDENGQVTDVPDLAVPLDLQLVANLPLNTLTHSITVPNPIAPPPGFTPRPTATGTTTPISLERLQTGTPSAEPPGCLPREDWTGNYEIQSGDTLSRIASTYSLSIADLQTGNCLTNPDRLAVGQVIRVPAVTMTPTQPPVTFTPSVIAYRADRQIISTGDCTTIRWDVDNVDSVFFEDEQVTLHDARQVCPSTTATYTLRVVYFDGTQTTRTLTITVNSES